MSLITREEIQSNPERLRAFGVLHPDHPWVVPSQAHVAMSGTWFVTVEDLRHGAAERIWALIGRKGASNVSFEDIRKAAVAPEVYP